MLDFSFSAPKTRFLFFGRKNAHIFGVFYFSVQIWPLKITETVSALTLLTHEGPHSSVNFSHHLQPQSELGTNVGGLGHVRLTSQSRLKQVGWT